MGRATRKKTTTTKLPPCFPPGLVGAPATLYYAGAIVKQEIRNIEPIGKETAHALVLLTTDAARVVELIYLVGHGLGAKVGLLAAALDKRVKALAAINGFDPLRLDTADKGTEGIRHYSHLHGLMPRLGFFVGREARLPFDNDEAPALIAPRPVLLIAPELDRYARVDDVRREVEGACAIYRLLGRESALQLETPLDFARFPRQRQDSVFDWLERVR